jgi:hypothetical protein
MQSLRILDSTEYINQFPRSRVLVPFSVLSLSMDLIFVVSLFLLSYITSLVAVSGLYLRHSRVPYLSSRTRFAFGLFYTYISFAFFARFCLLEYTSSFHCYLPDHIYELIYVRDLPDFIGPANQVIYASIQSPNF